MTADQRHLDAIAAEGRRLIELARSEPDRVVPQYPTWTCRDLVAHTAGVHGRTTRICREHPQARVPTIEAPSGIDVFEWAAAVLEEMVQALQAADPEAVVWTMVVDRRLAFWERRMLIETGVHRWDAQGAVSDPGPLPALVATAGLDEFAALYLPRLGDVPAIELVDPDLDRTWRYGDGKLTAILEGTASDHFLRLMARPGTPLPPAWEAAVDGLGSPADR